MTSIFHTSASHLVPIPFPIRRKLLLLWPNTKPGKGKGKTSTTSSRAGSTITTTTIITSTTKLGKANPRGPPNPTPEPTLATKRRKGASSSSEPTPVTPVTVLPVAKKPRRAITLALKADFIKDYIAARELDAKTSASSIGRRLKYGFTSMEASRILKDREGILRTAKQAGSNAGTITRVYPRKLEVIEDVIFRVFEREIAAKLPVNDSRLREIAFQTYVEVLPHLKATMAPELPSVAFSDGWLTNFKKSRGIRMQQGHGEEGDVDWVLNRPKFAAIATLLLEYQPRDIYNCDETGLYLRVLTNRSLSNKRHVGRKIAKEARVTVMLCCNADGSHKIKPFVLSKNRPNGISNETEARLRCHFKHGYVNTVLFEDWLLELDADMEREGRHIALLLDNAPGHGKEDGKDAIVPKNIRLNRLPPRTTSVSQPLDAGIIRSFKVKYSRHMIRTVSEFHRKNGPSQPYLSNGDLWTCLAPAWDEVTSTTIRNCFAHVPTLPRAMQDQLRMPFTDDKDSEMDQLKKEMKDLYPDRAKDIEQQKDYGVLAYLKSCEGQGPNEYLLEAIQATATSERFKSFFTSPEDVLTVDEDDDDETDLDYAEQTSDAGTPILRSYSLRSGDKENAMVPCALSSQESIEEGDVEDHDQPVIQHLQEIYENTKAMLDHYKTHNTAHRQATSIHPTPILQTTLRMREESELMKELHTMNEESGIQQYNQYLDTIELSDSEIL